MSSRSRSRGHGEVGHAGNRSDTVHANPSDFQPARNVHRQWGKLAWQVRHTVKSLDSKLDHDFAPVYQNEHSDARSKVALFLVCRF